MWRIYSHSECGVVWLGEKDKDLHADLAMIAPKELSAYLGYGDGFCARRHGEGMSTDRPYGGP